MSSNPARVTIEKIGEESNGKPPHKVHFPRKTSECLARNQVGHQFTAKEEREAKRKGRQNYNFQWKEHSDNKFEGKNDSKKCHVNTELPYFRLTQAKKYSSNISDLPPRPRPSACKIGRKK